MQESSAGVSPESRREPSEFLDGAASRETSCRLLLPRPCAATLPMGWLFYATTGGTPWRLVAQILDVEDDG